jgi:hypothetical protein
MKKQSKKQIKAELINEISAAYKEKIKILEEKVKYLSKKLQQNQTKLYEIEQRALTAEDKLEQYADWNRRLQKFIDMNPEERKKAFKTFEIENRLAENIDLYKTFFKNLMYF